MSKPHKAFRRGYRFRRFAGEPAPTCSRVDGERLLVPLLQGPGNPSTPKVTKGSTVTRGDIIAVADGEIGNPIHAPATGTVESVGKRHIAVAVTEVGGAISPIDGASAEWENLDPAAIRKILYLSGTAGVDPEGIPTEYESSRIGPSEVERIVVRVVPDDLFNPAPECILEGDRFAKFLTGLRILSSAFPDCPVTVAVAGSRRSIADRIRASGGEQIEAVAVSDRYPQSSDPVLVAAITGAPYPYGLAAIHLGIVTLDYQTAIHAAEAVIEGTPVIVRRIALAGPSVAAPEHFDVPIGTPVSSLIAGRTTGESIRVIMDSVMLGASAAENEVVTRGTRGVYCLPEAERIESFAFAGPGFRKDSYSNTFLAKLFPLDKEANTNLHGERRACINCSFCSDACPVAIMPNVLHRYVERDMVSETLPRLGILRCIDCNLCTYVCPSKIPLADFMMQGKRKLFAEGFVTEEEVHKNFTLKGLDR